jgi:hypothetical protein
MRANATFKRLSLVSHVEHGYPVAATSGGPDAAETCGIASSVSSLRLADRFKITVIEM